jgi:phage baseplate assembly protein V
MAGIDRALARQVWKMIEPQAKRIANTISRGVVRLVNDTGGTQRVQLECNLGELPQSQGGEHTEAPMPYGFFSVPLPGAHGVVIFPGGDRQHPITIMIADPRYRARNGQPGEVGLRTDEGDEIRLARSHTIQLKTTGTLELGAAGATHGVIKGDTRNTAEQTFLDALQAYITAIKPIADPLNAATPTITAAITAFKTAIAAAISSKVKIDS